MQEKSDYATGIRFGLIIGLLYAVLLFLRYNFFASSPPSFGLFAILSYLIVLALYFVAGLSRKKRQGGFASFKEIFQTIFIAIVITELVYILFNFIYLKFVDPSFYDNFQQTYRNYLAGKQMTEEQIDKAMENFKDMDKQLGPLYLLKGLGIWIVVDSLFGLIFAAILKKKKEIFEETQPVT